MKCFLCPNLLQKLMKPQEQLSNHLKWQELNKFQEQKVENVHRQQLVLAKLYGNGLCVTVLRQESGLIRSGVLNNNLDVQKIIAQMLLAKPVPKDQGIC